MKKNTGKRAKELQQAGFPPARNFSGVGKCFTCARKGILSYTIKNNLLRGFTLMELMIASAVLIAAILSLLGTYTSCFNLNETDRNLTIALNSLQERLEDIHRLRDMQTPLAAGHYTEQLADFPREHCLVIDIFDNGADPDGISNENLFWISLSLCWVQQGHRIIGEDNGSGIGGIELNGSLEGTEDTNGNNIVDSPAQIITLLRRE